jgi:uncharacterized delta-60 repeat protein
MNDANGSASKNTLRDVPTVAPSAPVISSITTGDTQLSVQWGAVDGSASYEVYSNTTNDSSTASKFNGDSNTTDLTCTITGLTNGTPYYIWIKAVNTIGSSPFSSSASGTPVMALAPGTLDTTFNSAGNGAGGTISASAIQSDGKILIAGGFTTYNGTTRQRIARLNTDGSLDTSFDSSSGADYPILAIAIQSDGKILIGGNFKNYGIRAQNGITRLNADGSPDLTFNPSNIGTNPTEYINAITIQPDGKILIGGLFNFYNTVAAKNFARLKSDGTLDSLSFNPGTGPDGSIRAIAVQTGGKIFIGGSFTSYNTATIYRLACLNTDGTLDTTTFNPGTAINNSVYSLSVNGGKIIIGGDFTKYNSATVGRFAQINISDSTLDAIFNANIGTGADGTVKAITVQTDGKIIIGGAFTHYNTLSCNFLARFNSDGTQDTFSVGTGPNHAVNTISILPGGNILIGGDFYTFNGTITQNYIARIWGN